MGAAVAQTYAMKTLVILGARGYIGSNLIRRIRKSYRLKICGGDIRNRHAMEKIIKKGDVVINFAGTTTVSQDEKNHFDINVAAQQVVASVCAEKGARVIYFSTAHVYNGGRGRSKESDAVKPSDTYSLSKKMGEDIYDFYARVHGLSAVVLRLGSVYGPEHRKGVVHTMAKSLRERGVIEIPVQTIIRDLVYIDDVLAAIQKAVAYSKKGFHLFNITSGERIELVQLARLICAFTGSGKVVRVSKKVSPLVVSVSIAKAKRGLKFTPRTALKTGLRATLASYII